MRRVILCAAIVVEAAACSGGEKTIVEPPPPPAGSATIAIVPEATDASISQALGWTTGIPNAEITLSNSSITKSFTANASGVASLSGVDAGRYWIEVKRVFTASELSKVPASSGSLGFVGGDSITVPSVATALNLSIPASRRRSLVISEYAWGVGLIFGFANYPDGGYFELYNNSDSTIYLDGMGIGFAFDILVDGGIQSTKCTTTEPLRNDPLGLWVLNHQMFPGSGREHPVAPGGMVTIAQDAIDHRPIFPNMPDLRNADFEFTAPSDVDNPAVPNMIDRSLDNSISNHGLPIESSGAPLVLFAPVDLSALPRMKDPRNERLWWRIPADHVLDVSTRVPPVARILDGSALQWCNPIMAKNFDRQPGPFIYGDESISFTFSPQRKVIGMTADGRRILQDTGNSAVDFARLPVTPFGF
jgi:hypothetical protein